VKSDLAVSKNNKQIYAHMVLSAVAPRLSRQPHLETLLRDACKTIDLKGEQVNFEYDFGKQIGYDDILETSPGDTIFYARLLKAPGYTRFVKNRRTETTQFLSGVLMQDDEGKYELVDIWLGRQRPPLPDSPLATDESSAFWETHAVVYNGQQIMTSTLTHDQPYDLANAK
jgi:hypothetical protein